MTNLNIIQHLQNQIQYYQREENRQEKMENPSANDKAYLVVIKMMIKNLKSDEKKLLKTKI